MNNKFQVAVYTPKRYCAEMYVWNCEVTRSKKIGKAKKNVEYKNIKTT